MPPNSKYVRIDYIRNMFESQDKFENNSHNSYMNDVTFGSKLKELRLQRKLTQSELGKILCVSHDTISIWEKNKAQPDLDNLRKIAIIFDVTTDYLLSLETEHGTKTYEFEYEGKGTKLKHSEKKK